jgi:glutathione S-transferase
MVLAEKKLDYQFLAENVWSDQTQIAASNPLGKVPCLIMEGGESVFDSRVIVEYIDTLSPVGKLIPSAGRERVEVKTWEALAEACLMRPFWRGWNPLGRGVQKASAARPGSLGR